MTNDVLLGAIRDYFRGERQEMLAILAGASALALAGIGLYVAMRDDFAKGFAAATLLASLLLGVTAVSLLRRDPQLRATLEAGVVAPAARRMVAAEAARVAEIVRKYPYYRHGALALPAALTRRLWIHGATVGVLLLVVAQILADRYSEHRATRYAAQLEAALASAPASRPPRSPVGARSFKACALDNPLVRGERPNVGTLTAAVLR